MRESLCLYGLLLLGLLVARSWGRHEDYYGDCDDPDFVAYYDYYGLCDDHDEGTTETPTDAVVCEFPAATPPNATELEVSQIALCHVHCIDQYYNGSNFELEALPGFPNWNIIPRNLLHNNSRGLDCPAFLQLLDCRRGCIIQSRSSSSDCVRTCAQDECSSALPNLVPPCGRECSEDDCDIGCGSIFDIVMDRVNTPEAFPTEINPVAPPTFTQLLDENMQPIARYTVDISGAVLPHRSIRGGFSTLLFRVQNTSSGGLYYYWVEENELNLEAFNHEQVNISFAVVTVEFGTSSYSPSLTLNVEAIDQELGFPEQLTADNISLSFTLNDRLFEHFDVTVSWEKPEGFERATGYTVRISSFLPNCGIPTVYEVGQTQTSLALESDETIHPFITTCFYTVQVIVNPMCPSDEIGQQSLVTPLYVNTVRDEIRENVAISCPAVFNATSFRYNVNLTLTFPISQIILESINRFIIRTAVVEELNPMNAIGFLNDSMPIIREDRSRMSYTFPITYAPIILPNTAYNNTVQVVWDSERASSLPITNLLCHVGTLPPEAPGVVMDFTTTEIDMREIYSNRTRSVVVTVDYTWSNLQLQNPDEIPVVIDYQVAFVSGSPLLPEASSTGLQIDQYEGDIATGRSIRLFPTDEPVFTAFLQIRARAHYGEQSPREAIGVWSAPLIVTVDEFNPPPPQEITNLVVVNSTILDAIFIPESASVLASIRVDFEWAPPVVEFGTIQEYEAWLNLTSLEAFENPENGIYTFDAEERAGTITANFTMAVADGPTSFLLILQIRARNEFGGGPWSEPLVQNITVPLDFCSSVTDGVAVRVECPGSETIPGIDEFLCSLDGGIFFGCIPPFSISALSEGPHTIEVVGRRTDGSGTFTVGQSQFVIDGLDLYFINDTPQVDGTGFLHAQFRTNRPGSNVVLTCRLVGRNGRTVDDIQFDSTQDCGNGNVTYNGLPLGDYVFRVIAKDAANGDVAVIRTGLWIPGDNDFCTITAINRRVTVFGNNATIEFSNTGAPTGFRCSLDRRPYSPCSSPVTVTNASPGGHRLRIKPAGCGRPGTGHRRISIYFEI